jgi:hypothetical protein
MKNKEKKIVRLLEEGFSYDTIKKMNDYHLNKIYKNLVNEAVVRVPADKFDSIKDDLDDTDTVEVTEDDAALDKMANLDPNEDPNPEGNEDGPSDNMNANDGMGIFEDIDEDAVVEELFGKPKMKTPITTLGMFEGEIEEKSVSQQQQKIMGLDTPRSEVSKDVLDMVDGMTEKELEDFASTKHKGLPKKKKESKEEKIRQIEESIVSLIKKSQGKMLTKGDILSEQPSIAPARPTVKPGVKPERGTPYKPKHSPKPKAGTEIAPARPTVKPGVKPERGTPYKPKHSPKPKAGDESGLPEFLKFNNLNIQFRDE